MLNLQYLLLPNQYKYIIKKKIKKERKKQEPGPTHSYHCDALPSEAIDTFLKLTKQLANDAFGRPTDNDH